MFDFLSFWSWKKSAQQLKQTKPRAPSKTEQDTFDLYVREQLPNKPVKFQQLFARIQAKDNSLTEVNLANMGIEDSDVIALCYVLNTNSYVTTLDLSANGLGLKSTRVLAGLSHITSLCIKTNPNIDDSAIEPFRHNQALQHLNASYCSIADEGAKTLTETHISKLNLCANNVGNLGVSYLAKDKRLLKLDLSANDMDDNGIAHFENNSNLEELRLERNRLSDNTASIFNTMKKLKVLQLGANLYTCQGAKTLAKTTTIEICDLSSNRIGDQGAMMLADNKVFSELDLELNNITVESLAAFQSNSTLKSVKLSRNLIDESLLAPMDTARTAFPPIPG
ncbi:MAG: hypothetical protein CK424_01535 [Legionella sp.]|nr:MAG: hypothetical protein CK424_01535 [Legionella sp.]